MQVYLLCARLRSNLQSTLWPLAPRPSAAARKPCRSLRPKFSEHHVWKNSFAGKPSHIFSLSVRWWDSQNKLISGDGTKKKAKPRMTASVWNGHLAGLVRKQHALRRTKKRTSEP